MTMINFGKTCDKYDALRETFREIRNESIEYLKDVCSRKGTIDLSSDELYGNLCVTYDGGRHPEYNSNAYSIVSSVYLDKDGEVMLEVEECSDYSVDRIDWFELYGVASFIFDVIDDGEIDSE